MRTILLLAIALTAFAQESIDAVAEKARKAFNVPGIRMNVGGGNGNFNANGIPLTSVLFTINGADVMDPYNNLNNSGASNNLLGANEIAEAAVIINAFSPQYGRMAGGQVNLVGKTGTNAYHGNATYNYNDAIFNAAGFFQNSTSTPLTITAGTISATYNVRVVSP